MAIHDIFRCADEMNFAPEPSIEADFFSGGLELPQEEPVPEKVEKTPESSLKNWKFVINRAFMRGLTANDILNSIGDEITHLENAEEILQYIKKYEGLMGIVFVDTSVLEGGFPITSIPKKFEQFHRFAINCKNPKKVTSRAFSGMEGGDIDAFLNSYDSLVEKSSDVCRITGLPVLKKGMFNKEVISELLSKFGETEGGMSRLQSILKSQVLGINKLKSVETEKADLKFELKEAGMGISPEKVFETPEVKDFSLKDKGMKVDTGENAKIISGVTLDYCVSAEEDISFENNPSEVKNIKLDDNLRF